MYYIVLQIQSNPDFTSILVQIKFGILSFALYQITRFLILQKICKRFDNDFEIYLFNHIMMIEQMYFKKVLNKGLTT